MVRIARIYGQPETNDGYRVLVDRLWPRGVKKQAAKVDEWMKEIGPSDALRKWFGHKVERWPEFQEALPRGACDKRRFSEGAAQSRAQARNVNVAVWSEG